MIKEIIDEVLIGTDPEIFLFSQTNNKFVPVCGLVGGTKREPLKITDGGHAIQEDNVALEFNIPPAGTVEDFIDNINFVKNYITDTVLKPLGLIPKYVASAYFDFDDLQSPQAQTFGCDPDINAWTGEENNVSISNPLMRSAGGHIHIGYKNPNVDTNTKIIQAMDLFLGVQSILLDKDTDRRKLYGKAGSNRNKRYGPEYRVLSNFWIESDEKIRWAYENTMKALDFVRSGGIVTNPKDIIKCINTGNERLAREIISDYNMEFNLELVNN